MPVAPRSVPARCKIDNPAGRPNTLREKRKKQERQTPTSPEGTPEALGGGPAPGRKRTKSQYPPYQAPSAPSRLRRRRTAKRLRKAAAPPTLKPPIQNVAGSTGGGSPVAREPKPHEPRRHAGPPCSTTI